jgi:hypothetical protein
MYCDYNWYLLLQDLHSGARYLFVASSRAFGFWLAGVCLIYITIVTISFFLIGGGKLLDIHLDLLLFDKKLSLNLGIPEDTTPQFSFSVNVLWHFFVHPCVLCIILISAFLT